jgi:hypothetical protein
MTEKKKVLLSIKSIIEDPELQSFANNLPCAKQVCDLIDLYSSCKKKCKPIIRHNIILLLHEDFKYRYAQLKANGFVIKSSLPSK